MLTRCISRRRRHAAAMPITLRIFSISPSFHFSRCQPPPFQ
jgi:hypothetical protein